MNLWTIPLRICTTALFLNAMKIATLATDQWAPAGIHDWMQVNNLAALAFGILAIWCWGRK